MTSRVVLGLGGCVDYEIRLSSADLAELVRVLDIAPCDLVDHPSESESPSESEGPAGSDGAGGSVGPAGSDDAGSPDDTRGIASERDLVVSILRHLRAGSGGEHYVASPDVLSSFADRFDPVVAIGGTSVRAGLAMSRLGVANLLHLVCFNRYFRQLLPADTDYLLSGYPDAIFPHVIVQYDGEIAVRIGDVDVRAPSPNRLIYVNDPANESLAISDDLGSLLGGCRLFLLSGFNAIRDVEVLDRRLHTVREHLQSLPDDAWVYYEDAAFHRPAHAQRVRDALTDAVDIYGLNEDEVRDILRRPVDLLSASDVATALTDLRAAIPGPVLVVHTKLWSAAVGPEARRFSAALDQGIVVAATRFRCGDAFSEVDLAQTRDLTRDPAAVTFAADLERRLGDLVCCRAGVSLTVSRPTTVGLGDTFVGGFLAVLAHQDRTAAAPVRSYR